MFYVADVVDRVWRGEGKGKEVRRDDENENEQFVRFVSSRFFSFDSNTLPVWEEDLVESASSDLTC